MIQTTSTLNVQMNISQYDIYTEPELGRKYLHLYLYLGKSRQVQVPSMVFQSTSTGASKLVKQ